MNEKGLIEETGKGIGRNLRKKMGRKLKKKLGVEKKELYEGIGKKLEIECVPP